MKIMIKLACVVVGVAFISIGAIAQDFTATEQQNESLCLPSPEGWGRQLTQIERLGKFLFFDTHLSTPGKMSCATCHDPNAGFADPRPDFPTSQGVIPNRFGNRNAPTVAYASFSPEFNLQPNMGPMNKGVYEGGQNWDGKASNLIEQAKLPFLNPLEMNNPHMKAVVHKVERRPYAYLFRAVFGKNAFKDADAAYGYIAEAIAAYESSSEVNQFSSKYDYYLQGRATLTEQEASGLTLFDTKGDCARCHRNKPAADGTPPLFTSRHHANVGIPRNPDNPFYTLPPVFNPLGFDFVELGTGGMVGDPWQYGRVKIPTLRNVAKTAPYMHNGGFGDLRTVVNFYNTRDVEGAPWDLPEVDHANIIRMNNLGNLGLSPRDVEDIVAYLHTLTDGYAVIDPPSDLRIINVTKTSIFIAWNDNSDNEQGFNVERSTDGGVTWEFLGRNSANDRFGRDSQLTRKTTYSYRVNAYNEGDSSPYSNVVSGTTK